MLIPLLEELIGLPFLLLHPGEVLQVVNSLTVCVAQLEQIVCGHLFYLLFERAWPIMGMEGFLTALYTHPEEAHALCHGIAKYARRVFDRYLELGVDANQGLLIRKYTRKKGSMDLTYSRFGLKSDVRRLSIPINAIEIVF